MPASKKVSAQHLAVEQEKISVEENDKQSRGTTGLSRRSNNRSGYTKATEEVKKLTVKRKAITKRINTAA